MTTNYQRNNSEHDSLSFKTWIINLFEDERDRTSIKPVVAFLGALFLCGTMLASAIHSDFVPADFLVDAVMIITAIGMGADSLDKFSFRTRKTNPNENGGTTVEQDRAQLNYSPPPPQSDHNIGQSSNELL